MEQIQYVVGKKIIIYIRYKLYTLQRTKNIWTVLFH